MTAIIDILAREILDSRGNPTVEVDVTLEDGSHGPRRRSLRRLDRRPRGRRTARRRQEALSGQGRAQGGRGGEHARSSTPSAGMDAEEQIAHRRDHDRTRRHPQQGAPRRQRDPGRFARRRQGCRRRLDPAALPLCGRHAGAGPAGADDEHHQRRRPCGQSRSTSRNS